MFYLEKLEREREVRQIGENVIVAVLQCGHTVEQLQRRKIETRSILKDKKKTYLLIKY